MIHFQTENTTMPNFHPERIKRWIQATAALHGKRIGHIHYVFCSDEKILEYNKQWLQHDYYTDIITFDYSEAECISGDIYISIDTVASNAKSLMVEMEQELLRVIIHGILHLCGFKDKTPEEESMMHKQEDIALINI
jgi:probable rRNA maturation factor